MVGVGKQGETEEEKHEKSWFGWRAREEMSTHVFRQQDDRDLNDVLG